MMRRTSVNARTARLRRVKPQAAVVSAVLSGFLETCNSALRTAHATALGALFIRLPRRCSGGGESFRSAQSQPRRAIDKFPSDSESLGQMRSQRFYAKHFSSVMSTEQKIDAEFFSGDGGPVRSFPSDKRVDSLLRNAIDLRASSASHYAQDA